MSVFFYADIAVYFLVGVLLILYLKRPDLQVQDDKKPAQSMSRIKIYAVALFAGILSAALRFGMQKYFGHVAMSKVSAVLEPATIAQPVAAVINQA